MEYSNMDIYEVYLHGDKVCQIDKSADLLINDDGIIIHPYGCMFIAAREITDGGMCFIYTMDLNTMKLYNETNIGYFKKLNTARM